MRTQWPHLYFDGPGPTIDQDPLSVYQLSDLISLSMVLADNRERSSHSMPAQWPHLSFGCPRPTMEQDPLMVCQLSDLFDCSGPTMGQDPLTVHSSVNFQWSWVNNGSRSSHNIPAQWPHFYFNGTGPTTKQAPILWAVDQTFAHNLPFHSHCSFFYLRGK